MNKELMEREGWQEATITSGSHLERVVEMYEEEGFDVCLEKIDIEEEKKSVPGCGTTCRVCFENAGEVPYRVYTKPRASREDDESYN